MEQYVVLGKFYEISNRLKKNKSKSKETTGLSEDEVKLIDKDLQHGARRILHIVYLNPDINQRAIAAKVNVSSQAVSEAVGKLVNLNLMVKKSGAQNNENIIKLSEKGARIAEHINAVVKEHAGSVFADFSQDELDQFHSLLLKMK